MDGAAEREVLPCVRRGWGLRSSRFRRLLARGRSFDGRASHATPSLALKYARVTCALITKLTFMRRNKLFGAHILHATPISTAGCAPSVVGTHKLIAILLESSAHPTRYLRQSSTGAHCYRGCRIRGLNPSARIFESLAVPGATVLTPGPLLGRVLHHGANKTDRGKTVLYFPASQSTSNSVLRPASRSQRNNKIPNRFPQASELNT